MRSNLYLITILSLITLCLGFPQHKRDSTPTSTSEGLIEDNGKWSLPLNPPRLDKRLFPQCSTNAECFRKGLPPLKPVTKTKRNTLQPRQSAGANTVTGIIQVLVNGSPSSYVSGAVNTTYGGYGLTTNQADAMSVSFTPNGNTPVTFTLSAAQRPAGFPYLASVYGGGGSAMNIQTTDYSYTFLTAANVVIPVGPAQASASNNRFNRATGTETSLFIYNPTTRAITVQWTNTNNAGVAATIIYDAKFALFYFIGNFAAFQKNYPNEGEYVVTWRLIPQ
ncbi:uncharacterized protein L201_007947 [Kwoniella dendrophila CBS 6074]|uniref:DOMON domain-containing protein n=1 Tax=Kwoniella dendrophila CBS 6074 TaxID=1295534 RepID=A0AAX4K849_9TREE